MENFKNFKENVQILHLNWLIIWFVLVDFENEIKRCEWVEFDCGCYFVQGIREFCSFDALLLRSVQFRILLLLC